MNIVKLLNTNNIVKYLIFAGIVFSLIKIIPRTPLNNNEKSILLIISITALIGLDCILPTTENFTENKDSTVVVMGKVLSNMDIKKNVVDVIKERNGDYPTKLLNLTKILNKSKFSYKLLENMIKEGLISEKELKILFQNKVLSKDLLLELVKNKVITQDFLENITKGIIPKKPQEIDEEKTETISKLEKVKEDIKNISKLLQQEEGENEEIFEEELRKLEKDLLLAEEEQAELEDQKDKEEQAELEDQKDKEEQADLEDKKAKEDRKEQVKLEDKKAKEEQTDLEDRKEQAELEDRKTLKYRKEEDKYYNNFKSKLLEREALLKRKEAEIRRKEENLKRKEKELKTLKIDDNDMKYNELPEDFLKPIGEGIGKWSDNEYTILNTDKWRVPMPRPPVCISSSKPCEPCPLMTNGYSMNLREWDNSRKVTNIEINKKWANDQLDSQ